MKAQFLVLVSISMVSFFAQAEEAAPVPPEPEVSETVEAKPSLPEFILEKEGFYSVSAGYLQLPTPSDAAHLAQIDLNYLWVDQGLAQLYQLRLGLNGKSQALAIGYGLGFGRRQGDIHVGLLVNLGYAHLWDGTDQQDLHGMVLGVSPIVMGTLWKNWQFFVSAGWTMVPLASREIPDGRGFGGFNVSIGVGASVD